MIGMVSLIMSLNYKPKLQPNPNIEFFVYSSIESEELYSTGLSTVGFSFDQKAPVELMIEILGNPQQESVLKYAHEICDLVTKFSEEGGVIDSNQFLDDFRPFFFPGMSTILQ